MTKRVQVDLISPSSTHAPTRREPRAASTKCVRRMRGLTASPQPTLRNIYAVSDVHAEYRENMQWCEELSDSYRNDVLIVAGAHLSAQTPALALAPAPAIPSPSPNPRLGPSPVPIPTSTSAGDVADSLGVFEAAMSQLRRKFGVVFWVPGNHEFWLRRDGSEGADSLEKWARLEELCARIMHCTCTALCTGYAPLHWLCTGYALAMHWLCTACALPVHWPCTANCGHARPAAAVHWRLCTSCALPACAQLLPAGHRHLAAACAAAWRLCGARVPSSLHAPLHLRHRARHLEPEAAQGACSTQCECMHASACVLCAVCCVLCAVRCAPCAMSMSMSMCRVHVPCA